MAKLIYDETFFNGQSAASRRSAFEVVPLLKELVRPKSVVDVGCGVGAWLSVFCELGVTDVLGIDGGYVNRERLQIPEDLFMGMDLANIPTSGSFPAKDLAMCLEVAEHIPEGKADRLIDMLTSLAPVVFFSAAIPGQGETFAHVNEQWPDYWSNKFDNRGFFRFDVIRPAVWSNPHVEPWYCQNSFLYIRKERVDEYPEVVERSSSVAEIPLRLVHPELFKRFISLEYISTRHLAYEFASRIKRKMLRK